VLCACFCAERGQPASADYRPPLLASADEQGRCVLWQLQGCEAAEPQSGSQPRPLAIFQMESAIECLLLQGSLLACGSRDGCVTLANPVNPRPPRADGALTAAAATGVDVAGVASGAAAHEMGVHPPGVRLLGHTDWVTHVQLAGRAAAPESDEGGAAVPTPLQWLCTASRDRSLRVWCVRSHICLHELRCHTRWINGLAISSYRPPARDLGRLAACSPLTAAAAATAAAKQPAEAEHFAVTASADGTLAVWRLRDGRQLATLRGHTRAVTCFQLSGTRVVSASMDRTILAWELAPLLARSAATADEEATATADEGAVETAAAEGAAAFAEDDDAPAGGDATPVAPAAPAAEDGEAPAVAETAEAVEAAEAVEVIDDTPDECKLFEVSDAHEDFVRCVCFDHHKLLSCADDGRVYLFSFDA
jgi:WD40 repeat protein